MCIPYPLLQPSESIAYVKACKKYTSLVEIGLRNLPLIYLWRVSSRDGLSVSQTAPQHCCVNNKIKHVGSYV